MDRIIIFGAGNTGKRAYEQNHEKYDIQCFLDNDQKSGGSLCIIFQLISQLRKI